MTTPFTISDISTVTPKSYWAAFCKYINNLSDSGPLRIRHFRELEFLAQVLKVFAAWTSKPILPWETIEPALQKAFPPKLLQPILDAINGRKKSDQNSTHEKLNGEKRPLSDDQGLDTQDTRVKRARADLPVIGSGELDGDSQNARSAITDREVQAA